MRQRTLDRLIQVDFEQVGSDDEDEETLEGMSQAERRDYYDRKLK